MCEYASVKTDLFGALGPTREKATNPADRHSLLVVSQSLEGGGAQRVITILLRHLDRKKFQPSLALFTPQGAFLDKIPPDVPVYDVGERSPYNVTRTAAGLRRVIRSARPSVVLSVMKHPNLITLALCRALFRAIPVVIAERNTLSLTLMCDRGRLIKRFLHRRLYPCAKKIVAVSRGVKEDLECGFGISGDRIQVIDNPCDVEQVRRLAAEEPKLPIDWSVTTVMSAGRLTEQKGFRYLLEAFAAVSRERPCQLLLLGEGEEGPALARQATRLGIADKVLTPGFVPNPFAFMARAHAFVLSSLWEGFPNVIIEAMACGTPVVSTSCPSGPVEIITHGLNGLLVPPGDSSALAHAIDLVLTDRRLARHLGEGGRARVQAFSPEIIVRQYEAVLEEAIGDLPHGAQRSG